MQYIYMYMYLIHQRWHQCVESLSCEEGGGRPGLAVQEALMQTLQEVGQQERGLLPRLRVFGEQGRL